MQRDYTIDGNALIGQSGGPTAVINQSVAGVIIEAMMQKPVINIYGSLYGIRGVIDQDLIDLGAQSADTIDMVAKTTGAGLGSIRKSLWDKTTGDVKAEDVAGVFDCFKRYNIRYFFYIGGNDSAETNLIISRNAKKYGWDVRCFHVPKTVDNDLLVTDHCPGFGSAARFVATAVQGIDNDNKSMPGVQIEITMGRNAGWIAAASVLGRKKDSDGPHLIYVPEVEFNVDTFLGDVDAAMRKYGRCLVVASEGIADHIPSLNLDEGDKQFGHKQLSGTNEIGEYLARLVKDELKLKRVRQDTLGYLQRSFPLAISKTDADEAFRAGMSAVNCAMNRMDAIMITLDRRGRGREYHCEMGFTDLENVAEPGKSKEMIKPLPEKYIAGSNNIHRDAFAEYAEPLVGGLPERCEWERIRPRPEYD